MIGIGEGLLALSISAPVITAMIKFGKRKNGDYKQPCSYLTEFQKETREMNMEFREEVLQRLTRIESALKER